MVVVGERGVVRRARRRVGREGNLWDHCTEQSKCGSRGVGLETEMETGGRGPARGCRGWVQAKAEAHGRCGRMLERWSPGQELNPMILQGLPRRQSLRWQRLVHLEAGGCGGGKMLNGGRSTGP